MYSDPNFSFEELPDNWVCPVCKMPKKGIRAQKLNSFSILRMKGFSIDCALRAIGTKNSCRKILRFTFWSFHMVPKR